MRRIPQRSATSAARRATDRRGQCSHGGFGKTGRDVSEIGFGASGDRRQLGRDRRRASRSRRCTPQSMPGVTFFDTADVYGDGRSERLIGRLLRERTERLVVATKFGRRAPHDVANYTYDKLRGWLERSRENLGVDVVDLVQLHCPPWDDLLHAGGVRGLRPARRGRARPRLRRQRREGRGGAEGDRVPGRRNRPDHLQHLPPATGRAVLRAGAPARRGRDHPGAARLRAADGQVRRATRRSRRTTTAVQPPRRAVRRRRDVRGRRLRDGPRGWSRSCGRSCRRARRSRSSRCAGSSTSTRSRR